MKEERSCYYEFGRYRLDPQKHVLWRGAHPIPLNFRSFDTLLILIQNQGRTVEKDDLHKRVGGARRLRKTTPGYPFLESLR